MGVEEYRPLPMREILPSLVSCPKCHSKVVREDITPLGIAEINSVTENDGCDATYSNMWFCNSDMTSPFAMQIYKKMSKF